MEFSSIWYFSFWSLVSLVFSLTGKYALRKATIPVSDLVKIQFESLIPLSLSFSGSYAFLSRPTFEHDQELSTMFLNFHIDFSTISPLIIWAGVSTNFAFSDHKWTAFFLIVSNGWIYGKFMRSIRMCDRYSQAIGNLRTACAGPLIMYRYYALCWVLFQYCLFLFLRADGYPCLWDLRWLFIFTFASIPSSCIKFASHFKKLITTSTMAAHAYEHRKIIEAVFGILGTTLAQYYFRVKSVALMLGLLSWSIAWLGILANVRPYTDLGIFHFLVTASLECAVSLFGLHFYTFLVVSGGIMLVVLQWKMEFVSLRHVLKPLDVASDWNNDSNSSSIQTHDVEQPSEDASNTQRLGIQRRLTQGFERQWARYARIGA